MAEPAAAVLARFSEQVLGLPLPVGIRLWDGSTAGPKDGPAFVLRDREALRRLLWRPGELGLARAGVAGDLEFDGDLYELLKRISTLLWERDEPGSRTAALRGALSVLTTLDSLRTVSRTLGLAGIGLPPAPPAEEVVRHRGPAHSMRRDKAAISHHYDVGNDFYALVLGPSLVYSCAYWQGDPSSASAGTLEQAQEAKLDLVCRKLALREGQRLLDVGCGWGSMAMHAAERYGVQVVGVTI